MPTYSCFIRGENFPLRVDGRIKPMGFYTTRLVEAPSPDEAEFVALRLLRKERSLLVPKSARTKEAMVYFERIVRVSAARKRNAPNTGFTFFPM
jgi:hypothetical protein